VCHRASDAKDVVALCYPLKVATERSFVPIPSASGDCLLMNIQTCTAFIHYFHDSPRVNPMAGQIHALTRFCYACSPPKGGDNCVCLQASRSTCYSGSRHHQRFDLGPVTTSPVYHGSGTSVNCTSVFSFMSVSYCSWNLLFNHQFTSNELG
jgi:hypothetical protein